MSFFRKKKSGFTVITLNENLLLDELGSLVDMSSDDRGIVYYLTYDGTSDGKEVENLRKEVNAILLHKHNQCDKVLINLNSGGGYAHMYGLISNQILRLRSSGFNVTVMVDEIAASGGYMAACVANKIVAAEFAIIGSIGVVVDMFNYSAIMEHLGIFFKSYTAGEFKRGVSPFIEENDKNVSQMNKELMVCHEHFKNHILRYRNVDIGITSTGETWNGTDALKLGLIDEVGVSDDIILQHMIDGYTVKKIKYNKVHKKSLFRKLFGDSLENIIFKVSKRVVTEITNISYKKML